MSRLTLRLPETLHRQLINLAEEEGISLNQYIVYALTRQVASAYTVQVISEADRQQQQRNYNYLIAQLGKADEKEIEKILSQREVVQSEPELTPDLVNLLKKRIQNQKQKK